MRWLLLLILLTISSSLVAQHCPWDCSGLVILDWPKNKEFSDYTVSLVDSKYAVVNNNNVYDSPASIFLIYEDLKKDLVKKIPANHWYEYDTAFYFAKESPVTLYNYCEFNQELFVEVVSKDDPNRRFYFRLNERQKFHLHETRDWQGKTPETFDPKFKVKIKL